MPFSLPEITSAGLKTPKLYFLDTGLVAWLLGIQNADQLAIHSMRGALFEGRVIQELLKARFNLALVTECLKSRVTHLHPVLYVKFDISKMCNHI